MPQLAPESTHTAVAPITVMPSGLNCNAEVFLGPDEITKVATSGLVPFTSTGVSQDVRLPVTMPSVDGTYHVFIDVYAEGILVATYQALEDVAIGAVEPFAYSNVSCSTVPYAPLNRYHASFSATITNQGSAPQTAIVTFWMRWSWAGGGIEWWDREVFSLTLGPGESHNYYIGNMIVAKHCSVYMYLADDLGGESSIARCTTGG